MTTAREPFDAKDFLKNLTSQPGVYQMLDRAEKVIYVGKARNLKQRVSSYFSGKDRSPKTQVMVGQVHNIQVIVTRTEGEALILENNLIKEHRPRYNILLRDDKSYPYIFLDTEHDFPRLGFYRGTTKRKGRFFGPYPHASSVRESLQLLQKIFPVRQCEDTFYRSRSRPCLQYQIKRCTGPCVGLIDKEAYAQDVADAVLFLDGKSQQVITQLAHRMERAAADLQFEQAARYRDQIRSLRHVQEKQYVSGISGNMDLVVCALRSGVACVQVVFVRDGRNLGNKTFFPTHVEGSERQEIVAAFLPQYYLGKHLPTEIIVNCELAELDVLSTVLADDAGHKVTISARVIGDRARFLAMAEKNAEVSLAHHLATSTHNRERLSALQEALDLPDMPNRLECFDVSHTQGNATVASCVVFAGGMPEKHSYRRFNIEGVTPGDDFGAMRQVILRRYKRVKAGETPAPDVLFIDGGKGQMGAALDALAELELTGLNVIGVSKGEGRKAGLETLHLASAQQTLVLPSDSPALHVIQSIRDEAHRFAVTGHRKRRDTTRGKTPLDEVVGLGAKRRRLLLTHFGGLQGILKAGVEELTQVPGISLQLAERIYAAVHMPDN